MGAQDRQLLEENWSRIRGSMQGLQSGKKSFGIMRVAKIKTLGNMGASLSHTFRERETPNADPERMKDNTVLVGGTTTKEVLADWHYRAPEKIRSNAVHGLEYFIGGSPEKLQSMSREDQDAYFNDALDWIKERHGEKNVLSAVIHRDETTPHMSVMTIPLDERGKLNARSFVGNKKALSDLQSDFAEKVSEQYGLRRGIKGSVARHERVQRVYGAYSDKTDAVDIPERLRGSLLGAGKESDAEWHARATEAATARVRALMLEMMERDRVSDTKINLSNQMIETLEGMVTSLGDELAEVKGELDAERETAAETAYQNRRLETSLSLAGMTDKAEAAIQTYTRLEERVRVGDLKLVKDAVGSDEKLSGIADVFYNAFPDGTPLTDDQARFQSALHSVLPDDDETEATALPYTQLVLERMREDRTASPLNSIAERRAFLDEIEDALSDEDLIALRAGNSDVLAPILGGQLEEAEQLRLALAYYQQTDMEIPNHALRSVADRLVDVEEPETHSHRDRGPIH